MLCMQIRTGTPCELTLKALVLVGAMAAIAVVSFCRVL